MKHKTIEQLRRESPGKYVFLFVIGTPDSANDGEGVIYRGVLPIKTIGEMTDFETRFRKLLLSVGGELPARKPPKGFVSVLKSKVSGEEGE